MTLYKNYQSLSQSKITFKMYMFSTKIGQLRTHMVKQPPKRLRPLPSSCELKPLKITQIVKNNRCVFYCRNDIWGH